MLAVLGVLLGIPERLAAAATNAAVAGLPAVIILVVGAWVCLLTQRRMRASPRRWVRAAADLVIAAVAAGVILLLADRGLLATLPAAGLLFPVAAWGSFRTWRVMSRSRRLPVRAGADIVLSLLLGTDLVLLLVWGANLLGLPRAEVAALRATLQHAGALADLPWWLWAGLYALLAAASLAAARWHGRAARVIRWPERWHIVPSIGITRRLLAGVHIGLLVIVLVGLAVPGAVKPVLRGKLKTRYAVALQRVLPAESEVAAYAEVRRQFTAPASTPPPANTSAGPASAPLAAIVGRIHGISSPRPSDNGATGTERDLARRVGQVQATALQVDSPPSMRQSELAAMRMSGLGSPIRDRRDLDGRLSKLDSEQHQSAEASPGDTDRAAEFAAAAVANTIQFPGLGGNEAVQVVKEYLSGLVESGRLKDIFAAWATHLTRVPPPSADRMVVPDPERLEAAASSTLAQQAASAQVSDPSTGDRAGMPGEAPAVAAVDLVNEARSIDEGNDSCGTCSQPPGPGGGPGGPGYPPVEPRPVDPVEPVHPVQPVEPPPEIHIPVP